MGAWLPSPVRRGVSRFSLRGRPSAPCLWLEMFLWFYADSWGSWLCCCPCCCRRRLIPADSSWGRGRRWLLEMADAKSVHETRFEAAVKVIQSLPKNGSFQPTHEMMLKFYSFYKQATEGPCKLSRPGFWDPIGRYKWDAWSSLGDMTKEEAMIAYVEEMKKIIETMPMTEKVEELLHVIGPFYEIVEDKRGGRSSDLTSDLGDVLTPTLNAKAVNGKAESSDSGAESEEEEAQEGEKRAEPSDDDINDDHVEDASGILHLTSDSDSEIYCDSMEQFGQEESPDSFISNTGPFQYFLSGDPNKPLENSCFPEDVQGPPGNGNTGTLQVVAVEGRGEVKHGGEDGRSDSGAPQHGKRGGESEGFSHVRRARGHRMPHLSEETKGRQVGSGGDGERWGSDRDSRGSLSEQIALVLMRLQEDMQNVLQRLHKLETLTASQAKLSTLQSSNQSSQRPSWWPFEMSPGALTFAIVWPFIVQWLVHLYYQRRRSAKDQTWSLQRARQVLYHRHTFYSPHKEFS
ncbi:acyl-CoA-binding domain-containing protein 5 isoform X6 [Cavia porcellus]|uniref:acyl-CoA-binding domain-containing protein 5 isoform X6 n=1 Tax=Cavia porcellus TaxID=10141 RepID=UPI002FE1A0FF